MITEECGAKLEQELNLDIVTLEECVYKYKNHNQYAVCSNGKLKGFNKEEV